MMNKPPLAEIQSPKAGAGDGDHWWLRLPDFRRYRPSLITLVLFILLVLLVTGAFLTPLHRWGDASTYYMQTASIAKDFDIEYLQEDIQRILEDPVDDIPAGVFLTRTEDGRYFYSKEFSYAFFAAPFFGFIGNNGILVFNAVMFWGMILIGYLYLKKKNRNSVALITSILFFTLSAAFVYVFWVHTEIYNMLLITAGLFIWLLYYENLDYRYLLGAAVIFGIATVAKLPNALLFLPIIAFEFSNRRWRNILLTILFFSIPLLAFYGSFFYTTGYQSFYGGERQIYVDNYPFLESFDESADTGMPTFSTDQGGRIAQLVEHIPSLLLTDTLKRLVFNTGYYFLGRFTGALWYYPFSLFGIFSMGLLFRGLLSKTRKGDFIIGVIRGNQERFLILAGILLYISVFLFFSGNNYFGGNHAVGNRYFAVYPAFLFLIGYIDYKKILAFTLIALIIIIPVIAYPLENSQNPYSITTHFPYKYLPVEYTQVYNLPLWNNKFVVSSDYRWYMVQGYLDNQNTALRIRDSSDFVVVSDKEREIIQLMMRSEMDNNRISIRSGSTSESVVLNSGDVILLQISGMQPEYEDSWYHLYRLTVEVDHITWVKPLNFDEENNLSFTYFTGWHVEEDWNGIPSRWMSNNATLIVFSPDSRNATLKLDSMSFSKDRTLEIFANKNFVKTVVIPAWSPVQITTDIILNQGVNEICFSVPEGCERPVDIPGSTNPDGRCLSMGMQKISLESVRM